MDAVDGLDLRSLLTKLRARSAWIPAPAAIDVCRQLLEGLHYAHQRRDGTGRPLGIVHRDLNPGNVLISRDGAVKITDFGLARVRDKLARTEAGVTRGTAWYMSPEQATGKPVDARSDLFSMGILLYLMLGGAPPFHGADDAAVMRSVVNEDPPTTPLQERGAPAAIVEVVTRLLRKKPEDRYASALAAADVLVRAVPAEWTVDAQEVLAGLVRREAEDVKPSS
jgi:serine/threonine-protein kinase